MKIQAKMVKRISTQKPKMEPAVPSLSFADLKILKTASMTIKTGQ
ncbi:MAG: hypothetical protein JWP91_3008 [Fibrobacteres bacterium]|nr:hypothetical protein [Fibrobacterota bacterium]